MTNNVFSAAFHHAHCFVSHPFGPAFHSTDGPPNSVHRRDIGMHVLGQAVGPARRTDLVVLSHRLCRYVSRTWKIALVFVCCRSSTRDELGRVMVRCGAATCAFGTSSCTSHSPPSLDIPLPALPNNSIVINILVNTYIRGRVAAKNDETPVTLPPVKGPTGEMSAEKVVSTAEYDR